MKKEPLLTNFPRHIIATGKRKIQASLKKLREKLILDSANGYATLFNHVISVEFLRESDPTKRNRHYGCVPVFWAWISQILAGNASCSKAIGMMQAWSQQQGLPVPSSDTSSYCKGRIRLPESFIERASNKVLLTLNNAIVKSDRWHGLTLKAIDGSSIKLSDTELNQVTFPQPNTQKPGCGFPVMGMTGLLNLSHGGWEAFTTATQQTHDATMAWDLLDNIQCDDLILADRAYCSYVYIATLLKKGAHSLIRLHQKREAALDWKKGKKNSSFERIVSWKKPTFSGVRGGITREQWEHLPKELSIRLIRLGYEDRAGSKKMMTLATTLTDHHKYDGLALHSLYARRWEIEVKLRDIKTTMGFDMINVKSPEMAIKTLKMVQLAYNLIRCLIKTATSSSSVSKEMISFKETLDLTISMAPLFFSLQARPRKLTELRKFMSDLIETKRIKYRPYRREPRAVKRRPKSYALLTQHRSEYVEIPHRSSYRKQA